MPQSSAIPAFDSAAPGLRPWWSPTGPLQPADQRCTHDTGERQFVAMQAVCRRSGGIASDDDVLLLLRRCSDQPLSKLARWIVSRHVVSFKWHARTWLPMFQFDPVDMSLRPGVAAVIRELSDVFDDWELMAWFTSPNEWLRDMAPVDAIAASPAAVFDAARADRFIAGG